MEQTLLLNASYEPLKIVHWQKAVTLWCQGKVEVISVYDREIRAVSFSFKLPSVIRLLRYIKIKRRFDYVPFSRANIYARDDHTLPVLRRRLPDQRADLRSCGAGRPGRPQGLGEHRHLLRHLQPPQGRTDAGRSRHAPACASRSGPQSAPAIRITVGLRNAPESWRDYFYWNVELDDTYMARARVDRRSSAVGDRRRPHHASKAQAFPSTAAAAARCASATHAGAPRLRLADRADRRSCPTGLDGGPARACRVDGRCPDETAFVDVAAPFATGLHQVDNPVFDRDGNLYVTFSGTRGQQVPVVDFRVRADGTREPFRRRSSTRRRWRSIARAGCTCRAASKARLSRRRRTDRRAVRDTISAWRAGSRSPPTARCSSAIDRARSSRSTGRPRATTFASLPASVAAFHLAFGPDGALYVTGADARRRPMPLYRIAPTARHASDARLRPSAGARVRRAGALFVVEALAGASGALSRAGSTRRRPNWCSPGPGWSASRSIRRRRGRASNETVYRLAADLAVVADCPHGAPRRRTPVPWRDAASSPPSARGPE